MTGWIKLHRKTKNWEWSDDPNVMCLWVHLLIRASFNESNYRGVKIPIGAVVYGHSAFSQHTGLSVRQVRTALGKLEKSKNVTIKRTNKFSIISMTNWIDYQGDDRQVTGERQASDRQVTAYKEGKEGKEGKKVKNTKKEKSMFTENELRQYRKNCPSLTVKEFEQQVQQCEVWLNAHGSRTPELTLVKWLQKADNAKPKKVVQISEDQKFMEEISNGLKQRNS